MTRRVGMLYAYARNNPLKCTDPDGLKYRLCDNRGQCIDVYSDADFKKYCSNAKDVTLKNNQITVDGKMIGTFDHLSSDEFSLFPRHFQYNERSAYRHQRKGLIANLAAESAISGVAGFVIGKAVQAGVEAYSAYRSA